MKRRRAVPAYFFPRRKFREDELYRFLPVARLRGVEEKPRGWYAYLRRPLPGEMAAQLRQRGARALAVADRDWLAGYRKQLKPLRLTPGAVVLPDRRPFPAAGRAILHIPLGQAFGTGEHATTALCAGFLEKEILRRPKIRRRALRLLDVGTGSGILAILAAKLGVGRCRGLEVDRQAVAEAKKNIARNRVAKQVKISLRPLEKVGGRFDLIAANILSQTLIRFRDQFARLLAPDGSLVLSGILRQQGPEIEQVFDPALRRIGSARRGDWLAYLYRHPGGQFNDG